jgi:biopolymer transport protein TolR
MKKRIRRRSSSSQINVTNLVDVSLTLVVIFILTAPLLKEGIEVDTPETTSSEELSNLEEPIIVAVTDQKAIYVNEQRIEEKWVGKRVKAEHEANQERTVLLKADAGLDYGFVIQIMDQIREAGVKKLSLVTRPKEKEQKAPL